MSPNDCIEILVAGNMLGLKRLVQLCEKTIAPLIDDENVINWNYIL